MNDLRYLLKWYEIRYEEFCGKMCNMLTKKFQILFSTSSNFEVIFLLNSSSPLGIKNVAFYSFFLLRYLTSIITNIKSHLGETCHVSH